MNGIKKLIMLTFILISYLLVACNQSVEFTIYFDSNGGSEVTSIKTGGSSAIIIPVNPTKDGYYFAGWYWDNNSFNRPFTANSLLEEPISNNMTVYAKWSSNEGDLLGIVTAIGFEIDGTTLYMEVPNSTTSYSFIGQITVSYSATWDLYNDISAVNKIASKTVILSPGDNTIYILVTGTEIKLYTVIIRRLPLCEVSFDVDGGSSIEPQYIQEGDFLEEPYTTKQGYTLVGWQTAYGSTITFPIKIEYDGLIIAVWQSNQSTLSFDANGGEGEMSSIILETNENINLPKNTFTKDGYMFIGWSESTEGNCTYQDEANYEIGILTSYILYAKWEKASTDGIVFTLKDDDTYEVTDYDGSSTTEIIIQNKYKDKAVTSIGASAFIDQMGYSKVISIHIPDSVTSIGEKAFYGRIKLESVTIPEGVLSIGKSAFSGCTSLTNVVIPQSVISIGEGAFSGCSSLIEITLPFVGASRTATNSSALFGYIFGTNSYTGGDSVKQYYTSSSSSTYFIPTTLRTVIITDTTTLGCGAFYNCSNLTNITIPENVTIINENVFYSCSGLTSITIPESITSIGTMAFSFCRSLTSITVPKSVTHIGDSAFQGCSNLIEMTLPFIGASRIAGSGQTSSLFGYIFGEFYYTGGVSTRQYYTDYSYETYYIPATLKTVIITDATLLGYGAFSYCSNLTSIIIPESVTTVSNKVFFCCTELTIYAQASSKPSGWDSKWNEYTRSVIWGYRTE
ncbi:MAG: leucine-rich repeat protein [Bacilli bacterium]|nr:leucine-rich repeat protein [Bacilli bacterium]